MLKKLLNKHTDKILHFLGCYFLTSSFGAINPIVGILVGSVSAIGKEIYDWFDYGKGIGFREFSKLAIADLIADIIGIGVGLWIVRLLLH